MSEDEPWYAEGLRFSCQEGCVACCTGSGGYVWVTNQEIDAIASFLGIVFVKCLRERTPPQRVDTLGRQHLGQLSRFFLRQELLPGEPLGALQWGECLGRPDALWTRKRNRATAVSASANAGVSPPLASQSAEPMNSSSLGSSLRRSTNSSTTGKPLGSRTVEETGR